MELRYTNTKLDWNEGTSFVPVSLFVELSSEQNGKSIIADIEDLFDEITKTCEDVIFTGDIQENSYMLSWLTPKLLTQRIFVTVVMDLALEPYYPVVASRIIYKLNKDNYKRIKFTAIRETDMILIDADDIKTLRSLIGIVQSSDIEGVLLGFNADKINKEQMITAQLLSLTPVSVL